MGQWVLLYDTYDHFFTNMPLLLSAALRTRYYTVLARPQAFRQIGVVSLLLLALPEASKRGTIVFVPSQHHL